MSDAVWTELKIGDQLVLVVLSQITMLQRSGNETLIYLSGSTPLRIMGDVDGKAYNEIKGALR